MLLASGLFIAGCKDNNGSTIDINKSSEFVDPESQYIETGIEPTPDGEIAPNVPRD